MLNVQGSASWTCCNVAPFKPHTEGINTNIFLWTVKLQNPSCFYSSLSVFFSWVSFILETIHILLSKGMSTHCCVLSCASWCSLYVEETAPLLTLGKHKASKYSLVPVSLTGGEGSNSLCNMECCDVCYWSLHFQAKQQAVLPRSLWPNPY